jgi:imidazolonepropionase-like amidohydrolase
LGGTLIPGIIDAHVHLASPLVGSKAINEDPTYIAALSMKAARKLLMRGWTTARDIGGPTQGLAKAIDEGLVDGPRIYTSASTITQTSGHGDSRGLNDPHPNMGGTQNYQTT